MNGGPKLKGSLLKVVQNLGEYVAKITFNFPFSERIGTCEKPPCYGGVARRYTAIKKIRRENENVLLLDAGDQYMGTMWYDTYKGKAARTFMNMMKYVDFFC